MNSSASPHFIDRIIEEDLAAKHNRGEVITRFPPEPNGYLHIGHAKSICLNFSTAAKYKGRCHLRFDDTNPEKEEQLFATAIAEDVRWLGFDWGSHLYHASDYFEQLFQFALELIAKGKAYVCELNNEEMRAYRGTLQQPGKNSPWRDRSVEENLRLFQEMRAGQHEEGKYVLRAKIDMSSGNINMRDPILYRIRHVSHQKTADQWCIYPMYDYTHCLSDALENISHSLCTLEFQDHRPLYDWVLENLATTARPKQIEFARLNLSHTVTSKRKLKQLVDSQHVQGWDDPRLPTLIGMRRRGYPAAAIRHFCEEIGISKSDSVIDMAVLEECVRKELNQTAARAMCVLKPLKITLRNHDGSTEKLSSPVHPQEESLGLREIAFSKTLYIERDDFMEKAPKKFHRLAPGKEVRLRHAYIIKCEEVIKNEQGEITELVCSYDKNTLGKNPTDRKVKGVIHWVSQQHCFRAEVRLYDRLFNVQHPGVTGDFIQHLNPQSLTVLPECFMEASLAAADRDKAYQFERLGYFKLDQDSAASKPIFNRIVTLRDSWAKLQS